MLFPEWITDHIANSFYWADRTIRCELSEGLIVSENDYTSNLTGMIRRQINARAISSLTASCQVLPPKLERKLGADACVVLSNGSAFKICLFEAKWPRLGKELNSWDYLQSSSKSSHFDDQLIRQSGNSVRFPTWEMFYTDAPFRAQNEFLPSHVSACVWHEHAFATSNSRDRHKPWSDEELIELLKRHAQEIDFMVREVCNCKRGELIHSMEYQSILAEQALATQILVIEYPSKTKGG